MHIESRIFADRSPQLPMTPEQSPATFQEEILPVVDANDIEISSAPRSEVHRRAWRHRAVHIIVSNSQGQILLQRRSLLKETYPGYWDVSVGGHVSVAETYEEAARREFREELGVDAPLDFVTKLNASPLTNWEFIEIYETRHDGPFAPPPEEITDLLWMRPDDVMQKAALERSWMLTRSGLNTIRTWCETTRLGSQF